MDELDLAIVRAMGIGPIGCLPKPPASIKPPVVAKAVGVTLETVKDRLARMERTGLLRGYQVWPNLRHLGLDATAFLFQVRDPARKAAVLRDGAGVEGLLDIHDFVGPAMCIEVSHAGAAGLQRRLGRLAEVTGDASPVPIYGLEMAPVSRPLTNLDWRILRAYRRDARRPPEEVAAQVGVSAKTVRRHFDRMAEEGSLFVVPTFDLGRAEGLLLFALLFRTAPGRDAIPAIRRAFEHRSVHTYQPTGGILANFDALMFARSAAEMEALRREALALPEVMDASAHVFAGFADHSGWIDEALEAQVKITIP